MLTHATNGAHGNPPSAIGRSASWCRAMAMAKKMAPLQMPVLITGQSGVGKEVIAQMLHHWSEREGRNFIPLNCGLLQDQLLESELFGHRKGAFTSASHDHDGLFHAASDGTLFLDEIGELTASCQAKLLRVLETGEYRPLGSTTIRRTNARIIAATHRDLEKMISQGRFRQDLYYRLNVLTIDIPPLSQRAEDIPLLVDHFLGQPLGNTPRQTITPEAMQQLMAHHWPGNVRELKNIIERLRVHCDAEIRAVNIDSILNRQNGEPADESARSFARVMPLSQLEKAYVEWVLEQCNGNISKVSKALEVSRTTIYRILKSTKN
ncbi:sigma-54 interaction domain-containing protein [Sedimenticola hydrogenitrophicus]|uniref:sigma-54 interaction domain-containing protein n=1 Tax=Sedimenticola hydrogenitrophicus TaxID=2967975 RepID=UPI0021A35DB1|nr:sigma-54 dependent transcriptional regulator [Sedimenticola hydrogenitrophicus]